jgi:clan AA aspartic protease
MIGGVVTTDLEAVIRLTVRGLRGQRRTTTAVIDTGYNGSLSLPPALIRSLGLPWRRRGRALLADGSETLFDIYEATVVWHGHRLRIPVDEADTDPLVGMALLNGNELNLQIRAGGKVAITPLP